MIMRERYVPLPYSVAPFLGPNSGHAQDAGDLGVQSGQIVNVIEKASADCKCFTPIEMVGHS
jgi:hypothetical protein